MEVNTKKPKGDGMNKKQQLLNYIRLRGRITLSELCSWKADNYFDSANRRARELRDSGLIRIYRGEGKWWYEYILEEPNGQLVAL